MKPIGAFQKLSHLSALQHATCMRATWMIPLVRLQLGVSGLAVTRSRWAPPGANTETLHSAERRLQAYAIVRAVSIVARRVPGGSHCLTRSLVLLHLLGRSGIGAHLRIGVTAPSVFRAHAWVEFADGEIANELVGNLDGFQAVDKI